MRWENSIWRLWLLRGLVATAAILMIVSFTMPWWTANISEVTTKDPIRIYGWGLQHDLIELREYVEEDETPFYQTVLAWVYLGVSAGLVLLSTWINGKKGKVLLGGIGLIYITYAAIAAFVVIAGRFREIGLSLGGVEFSLQGWNNFTAGSNYVVSFYSTLRFGYYLAYVAGGLCVILALLRNRITGKPRFSA